jgi:hypothetical protein
MEWPPRSPDLSPLDFFLRGHLKSIVCTDLPRATEALKTCFQDKRNKFSVDTLRAVTKVQKSESITAWHSTDNNLNTYENKPTIKEFWYSLYIQYSKEEERKQKFLESLHREQWHQP